MSKSKKWLYSGTFDPFTIGHLDIAVRAAKRCDQLVIAVLDSEDSKTIFSIEERLEMVLLATASYDNIEVIKFNGLLSDTYEKISASAIVRGLRNTNDLLYETPMAIINHELNSDIETIFLLARKDLVHVSSSNVRELGHLNNNFLQMVPKCNLEKVEKKFEKLRNNK
ncbi:MAG: pantetheine-phosphate adenylyltransferase [Clostridiaceae bacterium]|nr:pantetheine-phosphate adenylyltransferase [Clostridiaceae bacterium]